jgi:hypothetical protein
MVARRSEFFSPHISVEMRCIDRLNPKQGPLSQKVLLPIETSLPLSQVVDDHGLLVSLRDHDLDGPIVFELVENRVIDTRTPKILHQVRRHDVDVPKGVCHEHGHATLVEARRGVDAQSTQGRTVSIHRLLKLQLLQVLDGHASLRQTPWVLVISLGRNALSREQGRRMSNLEVAENGSLFVNGVEVRYMQAEDLLVQKNLTYFDVFGLVPLIDGLCCDQVSKTWDPVNLLLNGPKGNGKSLLLATYAQQYQIPYFTVECSEETRERHLKGGFVVKGGSTPYVLGTVANAIQVANEHGKAMLVFEEINALSPQRQKELNALTDFRKKVEIPELSWRVELQPGRKLFIAGTMNPSVYGGTYELNEDHKSRFVEIEMPYPPPEQERRILELSLASPYMVSQLSGVIEKLVDIAQQTRQEGGVHYALSTRDLTEMLKSVTRIGWEPTLFLIGQKFSIEDRILMADRIRDITKIPVDKNLAERLHRLNQAGSGT